MRTICDFRNKIDTMSTIEYDDLLALVDAYIYGTATPMMSLIKSLRILFNSLKRGNEYHYYDKDSTLKTISMASFQSFIKEYFDDFVYEEILSDDPNKLYS